MAAVALERAAMVEPELEPVANSTAVVVVAVAATEWSFPVVAAVVVCSSRMGSSSQSHWMAVALGSTSFPLALPSPVHSL